VLRIKRVFDLDRSWKKESAAKIKAQRDLHLRPHTDAFFAWAESQYALIKDRRGLLRGALGYAVRQHGALTRFFDDGRLKLTNNEAERELRDFVLWRKKSFGSQSERGTRFAERVKTTVHTLRKQGRHVLSFLTVVAESRLSHQAAPSLQPPTR